MRYRFTRESFIPKGSIKVASKKSDAVAYVYAQAGAFYVVGFHGKAQKPDFHYRYRTEAARNTRVAQHFEAWQARAEWTAERSAKRKAWTNDYKVGEIVNTCWGYDQTNREYYEIVAVKGKHVTLRQVRVASYSTGDMSARVSPLASDYCGEPFIRLAQERGIKIGKHSHTYASRTSYREAVPGVKVYDAGHTSSYA